MGKRGKRGTRRLTERIGLAVSLVDEAFRKRGRRAALALCKIGNQQHGAGIISGERLQQTQSQQAVLILLRKSYTGLLWASSLQLNDSVWELHKPQGIPTMEVIFFHGLSFQLSNDKEAFWRTWLSRDKTVIWPQAWLGERFPNARILSISYDSGEQIGISLFQIIENLVHDIIWNHRCQAGQKCPVIFVGHCVGGLIIKQFLLKCLEKANTLDARGGRTDQVNRFLKNCKGIFFYSTPNAGSELPEKIISAKVNNTVVELLKVLVCANRIPRVNQPAVVEFMKALSAEAARINDQFRKVRHSDGGTLSVSAWAIGETLKTKLQAFNKVIVPEASARLDVDWFYSAEADHFDVSRARDKSTCIIFTGLCDFIVECCVGNPASNHASGPASDPATASNLAAHIRSTSAVHLGNLAEQDRSDGQFQSINAPIALEELVNGLYNDDNRVLQEQCGQAFTNLASGDPQSCEEIVSFPGALAGLVKMLAKDGGGNQNAKGFCVRALANFASKVSRELRWKIIDTPRVSEELSNGLYSDDNPHFQVECARAFASLTHGDLRSCERIGNCPQALAGLVKVLAKDGGGPRDAKKFGARALANLASQDSQELRSKIIYTPRVLEELSNGLYTDGNRYFQEECARAFAALTCGDLSTCKKIGSFPQALAGLIKVLAKDSGCHHDAKKFGAMALANIASRDSRDLGWKIIDSPTALEELANGLYSDSNPCFQVECASAFASLTCGSVKSCERVGSYPQALAGLVKVVAKDSGCPRKAKKFGAKTLTNLASQDDLGRKIIDTPRALEELLNGSKCNDSCFRKECEKALARLKKFSRSSCGT